MLKKSNIEIKGKLFETAYAKAEVNTANLTATFYIGASRESLLKGEYFHKVVQGFKWDRKTDPVVVAYNTAKSREEIEIENDNGEKETVYKNGVLYGWDDAYGE